MAITLEIILENRLIEAVAISPNDSMEAETSGDTNSNGSVALASSINANDIHSAETQLITSFPRSRPRNTCVIATHRIIHFRIISKEDWVQHENQEFVYLNQSYLYKPLWLL